MQSTAASTDDVLPAPPEILDIRGMASPANVLAVLNRAAALTGGSTLELVSDCNPWQLYDLLQQRGYTLTMVKTSDGGYTGMIRPRDGQLRH